MPPKKRQKKASAVPGKQSCPLWERYAPRSASELKVHAGTVKKVREWVRKAVGAAPLGPGEPVKRLLVLSGPPGVGKSAALECVCAEERVGFRKWADTFGAGGGWRDAGGARPSDFREPGYASQLALWTAFLRGGRYAALARSAGSGAAGAARPSLLVLDDLPDARGPAFQAALAAFCGEAGGAPAVLLFSENISEKSEARLRVDRLVGDGVAFSPHAAFVEFNPVTELKIRDRVAAIAAAERAAPLADGAVEGVARAADGDLRRAIATLEVLLRSGTADVAAAHGGEHDVCDVHAVGRLCRAKRGPDGKLAFDPDLVARATKMGVDATAAFVQFNCVDFFGDEGDLSRALDALSDSDLLTARTYSTNHARDGGDPVYPAAYVAAIAGRACAAHNAHPAPSGWRPMRKPRLYDVLKARAAGRDAARDVNFLHAPPSLGSAPPALRFAADGVDDAARAFSDDDIDSFSDDDAAAAAGT